MAGLLVPTSNFAKSRWQSHLVNSITHFLQSQSQLPSLEDHEEDVIMKDRISAMCQTPEKRVEVLSNRKGSKEEEHCRKVSMTKGEKGHQNLDTHAQGEENGYNPVKSTHFGVGNSAKTVKVVKPNGEIYRSSVTFKSLEQYQVSIYSFNLLVPSRSTYILKKIVNIRNFRWKKGLATRAYLKTWSFWEHTL